MEDWDAWNLYPQHRWVYNKLELSLRLGYTCGPAPMPVPRSGYYCVRPIMNLGGMAAQAKMCYLEKHKILEIPPAHFWCERFEGDQYSVNFEWQDNCLVAVHTSKGYTDMKNLYRFHSWKKIANKQFPLPDWITELQDVARINMEFIGNCIIEIHLRWGEDFPDGAQEIISVWDDTPQETCKNLEKQGYRFHDDYVDAEKKYSSCPFGLLLQITVDKTITISYTYNLRRTYMSDRTYGAEEKAKLERLVNEGVTVMQEVEDLQQGLKETVKSVAEELDIKPSLINKAIKVAKNGDWHKHYDEFEDLETIVTTVGKDK